MSKYAEVVNKGGRPRKEIDEGQFKGLCALMCTKDEIAGVFGINTDTLESRVREMFGMGFSEAFKIFSAPRKVAHRRLQFKQAEKSIPMSIFLGKQYLGQSEKNQIEQKDPYETMTDEELDRLEKEITAKVTENSHPQLEPATIENNTENYEQQTTSHSTKTD